MPRIITALFDDRAAAQRALQALVTAGVARDRLALLSEDRGHEVSSISGFRELSARDDTLAALHDLNLPDEDTHVFEEGLRRGCALLSARIAGEDIEEAIRVIEMFDPVDLDRRSEAWQRERSASPEGAAAGPPLGAGLTGGAGPGTSSVESLPGMGQMTNDGSTLGTADLRTSEMSLSNQGLSTTPTGARRAEQRAEAPGVTELGSPNRQAGPAGGRRGADADAQAAAALDPSMAGMDTAPAAAHSSRDAEIAAKRSPGPAQTAGISDATPDYHRREMRGTGRVRSYVRNTG